MAAGPKKRSEDYDVKVSSYKRKSRAEYYKEQIKKYQKADHSVNLDILPTFNPINQAFGGNLLLNF